MSEGRSIAQRKADVLTVLESQRDVWLATADRAGRPHLIAVSAWWDGQLLTIATTAGSVTAKNLTAGGQARLASGAPDDVVVIDAEYQDSAPVRTAEPRLAEGFASAVGWDPREISDGWAYFRLRPRRIQAYRGYDEVAGRDVMLQGTWLA